MTPKKRAAIEWFRDNGPIGLFTIADPAVPTKAMRQKLKQEGLIEEAGKTRPMDFIKYQISQAGLDALKGQ